MPSKPMQPCSTPGCPALVDHGACQQHRIARQRFHDQHRGSSTPRYNDAAWRRLRLVKLARNPMCEIRTHCAKLSITQQVATEVHHIHPVALRPDLRLDINNLASVCHPCHSAITMREQNMQRAENMGDIKSLQHKNQDPCGASRVRIRVIEPVSV